MLCDRLTGHLTDRPLGSSGAAGALPKVEGEPLKPFRLEKLLVRGLNSGGGIRTRDLRVMSCPERRRVCSGFLD